MQTIEQFIKDKYENNIDWFQKEVENDEHRNRIARVLSNKEYLKGKHRILKREDGMWKEQEYITTKLVLQEAKPILDFHTNFLCGKSLSLQGTEKMVKEFQKIYRKGNYNKVNYTILRNVTRYGDGYEYVYWDNVNKTIKSRIIQTEDGYPIYSEDTGEYIAFIEHYTNNNNKASYYNIYYKDRVEVWNNEGGELNLIDTKINISGLPIHYKNFSDWDNNFGRSDLEDIIPILDQIEDILSKMTDAVYTLSLNPLAVSVGQRIEGTINADVVGSCISLDVGEFKFANATMDYATIKLLLDTLHRKLEKIGGFPSVLEGSSNVANVSEVSLSMLYAMAEMKATMNEQWLREGIQERNKRIQRILELNGLRFNEDDYINIEFNYSKPINRAELLDNLKKQWDMGAISIQSIIEKSELTNDVVQEMNRIKEDESNIGKNNNNKDVTSVISNGEEIDNKHIENKE